MAPPSLRTVQRCITDCNSGKRNSFENGEKIGRPSTVNNAQNQEKLSELLEVDAFLSIRKLAAAMTVSTGTIHTMLDEQGFRNVKGIKPAATS